MKIYKSIKKKFIKKEKQNSDCFNNRKCSWRSEQGLVFHWLHIGLFTYAKMLLSSYEAFRSPHLMPRRLYFEYILTVNFRSCRLTGWSSPIGRPVNNSWTKELSESACAHRKLAPYSTSLERTCRPQTRPCRCMNEFRHWNVNMPVDFIQRCL